jgi:Fe-S cluster assembly protein SufD
MVPGKKSDELLSFISSLDLPKDSLPIRKEALENIKRVGLPSKRDEYWKYTDPKRFSEPLGEVPERVKSHQLQLFDDFGVIKLVFTDGLFDPKESDSLDDQKLQFEPLSQLSHVEDSWLSDFYGTLERRGQKPVQRPMAMLNTSCATDGVTLYVNGVIKKPIHIIYNHSSKKPDVKIHHCIKLSAGSSLTVIESGEASSRFNKVLEVDISKESSFNHISIQSNTQDQIISSHLFSQLAEKSILKSFTITTNGVLSRNEHIVNLDGNNGVAHLAAAVIGKNNFHHDDTVFVTHNAENCESRQVFKKVLQDGAHGVFQGKILVNPGAQKTDGYQISQSLLLDDKSQFLAKPELEIYADDVVCSHGSTSGAIDEESLFYLRSRGISELKARELLILAFLAGAIDEIEDENIAKKILEYLENRL